MDGTNGNPIPGTSGTLAYDGAAPIHTFTAVFTGLTAEERRRAVEGQTRAMAWQQTNTAGDRLGMTIYEVDEVGGPGMGGCPPGPNGPGVPMPPTAPVHYNPAVLPDAANSASQGLLKEVTVFPERDFISIAGFPAGADLQVIVRRGNSGTPVIGTASGKVGSGGIFEVNHPGGVCWSGQTPDIKAGDWVDVIKLASGSFNEGQTQRVIDARIIGRPVEFTTGTGEIQLRVNGSAVNAAGAPLDLRLVEQRIIQPDFKDTRIGRRDIRADTTGGRVENVPGGTGRLVRTGDALTSPTWRATYTGLSETERKLAMAGQSRAMAWLSTNGNGDRFGMTIFEAGETGGPGMGGCPAPGTAQIAIP